MELADFSLFTATDPDPVYSEISINIAGHMVLAVLVFIAFVRLAGEFKVQSE